MPKKKLLRRFLAGASLFCIASGVPQAAQAAATARALVRWQPGGAGPVTEYRVYVRPGGSPYDATSNNSSPPQWFGNPTPAVDGSMSAIVTYTPAPPDVGINYFTVVAAISPTEETGLSRELPIGTPNPCRNDSCVTKTSCDFSTRVDGTSCDDASFCNGPEVCRSGVCDTSATRDCADAIACTVDACDEARGQCTHLGPAGCCLACDSTDPCLADACAQGDCTASPGTEIEVNRVKFQSSASGIKLAAKGRFTADPSVDPTTTGVVVEMRAPDGVVLYSSSIAAQAIKARASGRRYRFTASRSESDALTDGLTSLDFRIKGSTWLVTAKVKTPELMEAFLQPTITWVIRFGATCVRRLDMPCTQSSRLSICR